MISSEFELNLASGNVKAAMQSAGANKSDIWWAPRENIRVIPGFNVREMNDEYKAHIEYIGGLILANGYDRTQPLKGYIAKEGDEHILYIYDGHTRLLGTDWANERGAGIEKLPIITAPAGTTMEDLTIGLVVSQGQKALTPYEKGVVCKRLLGMGLDEKEIARRLAYTKPYVDDLLLLVSASKPVRDMVSSGDVSASTAVKTIKQHGANAGKVLTEGLATAKASGKSKVTKSTLAPPKRNLLDEGIDWIKAEGGWSVLPDTKLAELLSHLTKTPVADVTARLNA